MVSWLQERIEWVFTCSVQVFMRSLLILTMPHFPCELLSHGMCSTFNYTNRQSLLQLILWLPGCCTRCRLWLSGSWKSFCSWFYDYCFAKIFLGMLQCYNPMFLTPIQANKTLKLLKALCKVKFDGGTCWNKHWLNCIYWCKQRTIVIYMIRNFFITVSFEMF